MPQYQGVWTLEAQAQAQSNQQWVTDPNFKNTTLLLQADGTGSGSQNQSFLDSSTNNFFIARFGNTTQGSFSPFSQAPGYWGNYFGGSSWISVPDSTDLDLASGTSWTIEAWVYNTGSSGIQNIMGSQNSAGDVNFLIGIGASNELKAVWCNNTPTAYTVSAPSAVIRNTWIHVAAVNNAGTLSLYVNGVSVGTPLSISGTFRNLASVVSIGRSGDYASQYWVGYISNARIVNGTALYTSNFTPSTTPFTDVANTKLLTCQSNRFVDTNTQVTAKTITIGGTPSVQAFGPFAPALQWTPDVVGGSGYFDGTGDYLATTTTTIASGSTAFQLEGWVYPTAISGASTIFGGVTNGIELQYNTTNISINKAGVSNILIPSTPPIINAWNHILACRNTSGVISIYLNGVRQATATGNSTTFSATTANIGGTSYVTGYLSGVRFINGSNVVDPTQSSFTLPTAPVTAVTSTVNLLNFTNAGIYDGAMKNNLETVGNAQVSTSVVKYGSGSMYFDGNGDYLTSASTQSVVFGTGDFTIEMWVFPTTVSTVAYLYDSRTVNTNPGIQWYINTDATMGGGVGLTNVFTTAAGVMKAGEWQHIAISKANGVWRIFRNGIFLVSGTNTTAITDTGFTLCTAFNQKTADTTNKYAGFIDDLRITKGVARYIENFTPPQQALPRQ